MSLHSRLSSMLVAAAMAAGVLVSACGASVYRPATDARFELDPQAEINDEDVRKAFEAQPQLGKPVRIAYYSFDPDRVDDIDKMLRAQPGVADVYRIPTLMVSGTRRYDQPNPWEPKEPFSMKKARLLAARAECDLLLVFDNGHRISTAANGWVATGILLVPLLFVPFLDSEVDSYTSHGQALRFPGAGRSSGLPMPPNGSCLKFCPRVVYLETYLIDTRNGYLYAHVAADRLQSTVVRASEVQAMVVRKRMAAIALAIAWCASSSTADAQVLAAPAQVPVPSRAHLESGLRAGYAVPMGRATGSDDPLSDTYGAQFLTTAELGVRVSPMAFTGVHVTLGTGDAGGKLKEACVQAPNRCWSRTLRAGFEAIFHPDPSTQLHPWFGYGLGYEGAWAYGQSGGEPVAIRHAGLEFGRLMLGMDFSLSELLRVGPFLDLSVGRYALARVEAGPGTAASGSSKGFHAWMAAGVKVSLGR